MKNKVIITVVVIVILLIAGWFVYSRYFTENGQTKNKGALDPAKSSIDQLNAEISQMGAAKFGKDSREGKCLTNLNRLETLSRLHLEALYLNLSGGDQAEVQKYISIMGC